MFDVAAAEIGVVVLHSFCDIVQRDSVLVEQRRIDHITKVDPRLAWWRQTSLPVAKVPPAEELAKTGRVAESASRALFGEAASRATTAAVAVSAFGCLAATILYSSRVYQPMAADGVFFAGVARIHPRWRTPGGALWLVSDHRRSGPDR